MFISKDVGDRKIGLYYIPHPLNFKHVNTFLEHAHGQTDPKNLHHSYLISALVINFCFPFPDLKSFYSQDPFLINFTVCYMIFIKLVWRIWYWIN